MRYKWIVVVILAAGIAAAAWTAYVKNARYVNDNAELNDINYKRDLINSPKDLDTDREPNDAAPEHTAETESQTVEAANPYNDARSAKEALSLFQTRLEQLTPEEADQEFLLIERFYRVDQPRLTDQFLEMSDADGFEPIALQENPITIDDVMALEDEDSKLLASSALDGGYKLLSGEGVVVPILDYEVFLTDRPSFTEAMGAYLELMASESNQPVLSDAAIAISWTELGERTVMAEQALSQYPDSVQQEQFMGLYFGYFAHFLYGSGNTEVFEYGQNGVFREKVQTGYDALLENHGDTYTADVLRSYLDFIKKITQLYPSSDDPNHDSFYSESRKFPLEELVMEKFAIE